MPPLDMFGPRFAPGIRPVSQVLAILVLRNDAEIFYGRACRSEPLSFEE
jgi:hypothetical protein